MSAKKWAYSRITVNLTQKEKEKLDRISAIAGRTITEILREQIRNMPEGE